MIYLLVTFAVLLFLCLIGIIVSEYIIIRRLLNKAAVYESWIITTRNRVQASLKLMRDIDKQGVFSSRELATGIFESDDLVGQTFRQLIEILEELNTKINE